MIVFHSSGPRNTRIFLELTAMKSLRAVSPLSYRQDFRVHQWCDVQQYTWEVCKHVVILAILIPQLFMSPWENISRLAKAYLMLLNIKGKKKRHRRPYRVSVLGFCHCRHHWQVRQAYREGGFRLQYFWNCRGGSAQILYTSSLLAKGSGAQSL